VYRHVRFLQILSLYCDLRRARYLFALEETDPLLEFALEVKSQSFSVEKAMLKMNYLARLSVREEICAAAMQFAGFKALFPDDFSVLIEVGGFAMPLAVQIVRPHLHIANVVEESSFPFLLSVPEVKPGCDTAGGVKDCLAVEHSAEHGGLFRNHAV
jgi:hypothetical protein